MITCTCPKCEAIVGKFDCYDDHGAVFVYCPKCETQLEIHNAMLDQADEGWADGDIINEVGGTLVLQTAHDEDD